MPASSLRDYHALAIFLIAPLLLASQPATAAPSHADCFTFRVVSPAEKAGNLWDYCLDDLKGDRPGRCTDPLPEPTEKCLTVSPHGDGANGDSFTMVDEDFEDTFGVSKNKLTAPGAHPSVRLQLFNDMRQRLQFVGHEYGEYIPGENRVKVPVPLRPSTGPHPKTSGSAMAKAKAKGGAGAPDAAPCPPAPVSMPEIPKVVPDFVAVSKKLFEDYDPKPIWMKDLPPELRKLAHDAVGPPPIIGYAGESWMRQFARGQIEACGLKRLRSIRDEFRKKGDTDLIALLIAVESGCDSTGLDAQKNPLYEAIGPCQFELADAENCKPPLAKSHLDGKSGMRIIDSDSRSSMDACLPCAATKVSADNQGLENRVYFHKKRDPKTGRIIPGELEKVTLPKACGKNWLKTLMGYNAGMSWVKDRICDKSDLALWRAPLRQTREYLWRTAAVAFVLDEMLDPDSPKYPPPPPPKKSKKKKGPTQPK